MHRIALAIASLAVALAIPLLAAPSPAHASGKIDWTSFDGVLPVDCDLIDATIEPNQHASTIVELVLSASPQTSWWKGIQIPDGFGGVYLLEVGNATKRASLVMPAPFLKNGQSIHFMKARLFGLHTGVYDLPDLGVIPGGARVTFHWVQDACPDVHPGFRASRSSVPDWMRPGERRQITMTLVNWGSPWRPDERFELANLGTVDWQMTPVPITTRVGFAQDIRFDVEITAPTTPGYHVLDLGIRQRGGAQYGPNTKTVVVQVNAPTPPPPPPPPRMVTVPDVVNLRAADAAKLIYGAGLNVFIVHDPSPFDPDKVVVFQSPIPGTQLPEKAQVGLAYQLVNQGPTGFASIRFVNCGSGTLLVFAFDGDAWRERGAVEPQWGDNAICPRPSSKPFEEDLDDGEASYYVVVDPARCSDPGNPSCRVYEWAGWGDAKGPVFERVVP